VGSFAPNAFGLHDVHGNLWELCRDPYGSYSEPVEPATGYRITNSKEGVVRGGSFESSALDSRTASRSFVLPGETQPSVGVRPARMLTVH
jgi:formylglycine-generating enzyme required for sulfatase activity